MAYVNNVLDICHKRCYDKRKVLCSTCKEVITVPRPRKCRKVCQMPTTKEFRPIGDVPCKSAVILTVDEYEAIRLIDKQGFSQEECSAYMQVARTTVQMIYNSARKKLADVLVDGLSLLIEGGDYQLCDGSEEYCGCGGCRRHRRSCVQQDIKEDEKMKIAIPLDENKQDVCIVLARAPYFLFREDGKDAIVENPAALSHGGAGIHAAQFLVDNGAQVIISGGMGGGAVDIFNERGVEIIVGVQGEAQAAVETYLKGKLISTGSVCHQHEHSHECGEHN